MKKVKNSTWLDHEPTKQDKALMDKAMWSALRQKRIILVEDDVKPTPKMLANVGKFF